MKTQRYNYPQHHVHVDASFFHNESRVEEIHACVQVADTFLSYSRQLEELLAAVGLFLEEKEIAGSRLVLKRYFLSDAANQAELLLKKANRMLYRWCSNRLWMAVRSLFGCIFKKERQMSATFIIGGPIIIVRKEIPVSKWQICLKNISPNWNKGGWKSPGIACAPGSMCMISM